MHACNAPISNQCMRPHTVPFHFLYFSALTLRSPWACLERSWLVNFAIFSDASLDLVGGLPTTLFTRVFFGGVGVFLAFFLFGVTQALGGLGVGSPFLAKKFNIPCCCPTGFIKTGCTMQMRQYIVIYQQTCTVVYNPCHKYYNTNKLTLPTAWGRRSPPFLVRSKLV